MIDRHPCEEANNRHHRPRRRLKTQVSLASTSKEQYPRKESERDRGRPTNTTGGTHRKECPENTQTDETNNNRHNNEQFISFHNLYCNIPKHFVKLVQEKLITYSKTTLSFGHFSSHFLLLTLL